MSQSKFCFLLVIICLLSGCGQNKFSPLSRNATIVAFGDSLTFGIGSTNGGTYPRSLAELTGLSVINAGISGERTSQGLKRFRSVLDKHSPELVILLEGGNDILRNQPAVQTKKNLASMIEIALSEQVAIILLGVPEKKLFSDSAPFYTELAEEYDLVFSDDLVSDLIKTSKYKSDPIHLNSSGYQKLAEGVYQLMVDAGAIN